MPRRCRRRSRENARRPSRSARPRPPSRRREGCGHRSEEAPKSLVHSRTCFTVTTVFTVKRWPKPAHGNASARLASGLRRGRERGRSREGPRDAARQRRSCGSARPGRAWRLRGACAPLQRAFAIPPAISSVALRGPSDRSGGPSKALPKPATGISMVISIIRLILDRDAQNRPLLELVDRRRP